MLINGTTGNDVILGTDEADIIDGLQGADTIYGGGGGDTITGGPGADIMYGEDGNDTLITKRGTNPDTFDGGAGVDRVNVDFANVRAPLTVDLTNPAILQFFGEGSSIVNVEQITIVGGTGRDRFTGGALADSLSGYDGDDVLKGAGGADTITGGQGYDVAVFSGPASAYTVTRISDSSFRVSSAAEGVDTLTEIETLRFSDGDQPIGGYTSSAAYWGSAGGAATMVKAVNIPDGLGALPGTGFTITGLTRAADGTWWAANEGQANASDSSYTPSLVHLSADMSTKLGEVAIGSKTIRSLQGIAYDDHKLYVASLSEGLIRVYSDSGTYQRSIAPQSGGSVNGVAYDTLLDAVIISHANGSPIVREIEWRDAATGAQIKKITVANEPDQLFFDATSGPQGALWYTYGDAGPGRYGYVAKIDVATGQQVGAYALPEADAIEGIVVDGGKMWIANDAYYHFGVPPLNRILEFDITPEAYVLQRSATALALTINLALPDQTLADGTRLVGIDRLFFTGGSGADAATGGAFADVLVGGAGADTLRGGGGEDRLVGAAGDDTLQGGAGNDGLEGVGGADTAVFSGPRAAYAITQLSAQSLQIADLRSGSPDGVDTVIGVESFRFADATYSFAQLFEPGGPPTTLDISLSGASIAENSAAGAVVGDLSTATTGGNTSFTYQLTDSANGRFAITGGKLVASGTGLDYEAAAAHSVSIKVTDGAGATRTESFSIQVGDVNEAPTSVAFTNPVTTLAENTAVGGGLKLATLAVTDDALGANALSLSGADAAAFEIRTEGAARNLYYVGPSPDFETKAAYVVTVQVNDPAVGGSPDAQRTFTLTIGDVDEGGPPGPSGGATEGDDRGPTAIVGTSAGETLDGLGGHDQLFGLGGADTLIGGTGDDELAGGPGGDVLNGGAGVDTAVYSDAAAGVRAELAKAGNNTGEARGDSYVSIENLLGSAFNDSLVGDNMSNVLTGGDGNDSIVAGGDSDFVFGGRGDDAIQGNGGTDRIEGGEGNDTLSGGSSGKDYFIYRAAWGNDRITDFEDKVDFIDLRGLGLTFADLDITAQGPDTLITDAEHGGTILIQHLQPSQLTGADFLF